MERHAQKHRDRNLQNYRRRKGLPLHPEDEEEGGEFELAMDRWPATSKVKGQVVYGLEVLDMWLQRKTVRQFGEYIYQLRFPVRGGEPALNWRGNIRNICETGQMLLDRAGLVCELAFKLNPSGRKGWLKDAQQFRQTVNEYVWAIDEMRMLEADGSSENLQNLYAQKALEFQKYRL